MHLVDGPPGDVEEVDNEDGTKQLRGNQEPAPEADEGEKMKRVKRILGVAAVVADLTLFATGCAIDVVGVDLDGDGYHAGTVEVSEPFSYHLGFDGQVGIRVTGANGSIRISGAPGAHEVVVTGVRRVRSDSRRDAQAHLAGLQVSAQRGPVVFEIKTLQPSQANGRSYIVDYEISVPSYLTVTVNNGNGSIRLEGIHADLKVASGNGDVDLVDVSGSSWVSLGNGEIAAWTHLPLGGQIVHSVGNGSMFLSVQHQVSASFGAKVGNGTISVTGLDMQQVVSTPRQMEGLLGSGQGLIELSAGNGVIKVQGR